MNRRARSALFGLFLMASQIVQGGLAASVPCADDSLGVLVPCATEEQPTLSQTQAAAHEATSLTCHTEQHCKFCMTGACHMTHVPALAVAFVAPPPVEPRSLDASAPAVDSFDFRFDLILRPPK